MNDIAFQENSIEEAGVAADAAHARLRSPNKASQHSRKEQGANLRNIKILLPWLHKLPPETRPKQLILQYPHVANRLAELWKYPVSCDKYFNQLILDHRGGRQGFPPEVAQEITNLFMYFSTHVMVAHYSIWGDRIGA